MSGGPRASRRRAPTIPVELDQEVFALHRQQVSTRDIADWLNTEKGCKTSHGSVTRLIRRLKREESPPEFALPAALAKVEEHRVAFQTALDRMHPIATHAFECATRGDQRTVPGLDAAFYAARREAALHERQHRQAFRSLVACRREIAIAERVRRRPCVPAFSPPPVVAAPAGTVRATSGLWWVILVLLLTLFPLIRDTFSTSLRNPDSAFERFRTGSKSPFSDLALANFPPCAQGAERMATPLPKWADFPRDPACLSLRCATSRPEPVDTGPS